MHLPSRLRSLPALLPACLALELTLAAPRASAREADQPRIADVEESLRHDRSYKMRVEAALILGRLGQTRSVPALVGGLRDPEPSVRAASAESLGRIGSLIPRDALVAALHDREPSVRRSARTALRRLGTADDGAPLAPGEPGIRPRTAPRPSFEVNAVGDPQRRAGPVLRSHMRDFLIDQLRPYGDVQPPAHAGTYAVDGVIKTLAVETTGRDVEVSCAVELIISRQPQGGIFMTSSGTATVQRSKRQWRAELRPSAELEALEAAVRGASEDLGSRLSPR